MDHPVEMKEMASNPSTNEKDQKIQHLKSLLLKQKKQNDTLKAKLEEQEKENTEFRENYFRNEQLLQSYLQEEKEEVQFKNIQKVMARIQINSVNWLGIKYSNKIVSDFNDRQKWVREENIIKEEGDSLPFLVDYEEAVSLKQSRNHLPINIDININRVGVKGEG